MGLFDIILEQKKEKYVIKIILASGPEKPYYITKKGLSEKGCFIRVGSASEPMPVRMIEDLFSKRTRNSIGKIVSNQQDLTFAQLKIYYEAKDLVLNENFTKNLELLTQDKKLNYVAYLMADQNGTSIKIAKYSSLDRVDLIENNEYGYCSLIKATKAVLDKLEIENKTSAKITAKERIEKRLWNAIALREAVINAIIHNDYSREIPPKFEIFPNRLEITSYGGLFEGMTQDEFYSGLSLPRNKELMRIFKDLEMVEQLGSGVPRILKSYSKEIFTFSNSFIRTTLPISESVCVEDLKTTRQESSVKGSVKSSVKIIDLINQNKNITIPEMAKSIGISTRATEKQIAKLKEQGKIRRIGADKGGHWKAL